MFPEIKRDTIKVPAMRNKRITERKRVRRKKSETELAPAWRDKWLQRVSDSGSKNRKGETRWRPGSGQEHQQLGALTSTLAFNLQKLIVCTG